MKTFKSFVIDIKDTQYGQRIELENGEVVFNRKEPVQLGFLLTVNQYDETQEWMENPIEDGKTRNYIASANEVGSSYINMLKVKLLNTQISRAEAVAEL